MAETTIRLLESRAEQQANARVVSRQMLAPTTDEAVDGWADLFEHGHSHGAFTDGELVGVVQWFPTTLQVPGGSTPAAAVTGVSVLSNHRRRGHLTRLIHEQLRHIAEAGHPLAVLIAAEYPIYGRFGYGPATESCAIQLDTGSARFLDDPVGSITYAEPAELTSALEAAYLQRAARTPGLLVRPPGYWERASGEVAWPGKPLDVALQRGATWRDDSGAPSGAVLYRVDEHWVQNRPAGTATVEHLYGATPEAERELWRHLCTLDWVRTVKAGNRPVDEVLGLWLVDARAAVALDRSDNVWARVLDLPAAIAVLRAPVKGSAVIEVVDELGYADGRWKVTVGPDGGSAAPTKAAADVRLPASTLGAVFLGGHTVARFAAARLAEEQRPGGLARATSVFQAPTAPWCPIDF